MKQAKRMAHRRSINTGVRIDGPGAYISKDALVWDDVQFPPQPQVRNVEGFVTSASFGEPLFSTKGTVDTAAELNSPTVHIAVAPKRGFFATLLFKMKKLVPTS